MNTYQLKEIIKRDKCLSGSVKGVFSPDTLPLRVSTYPSVYISNTENSDKPGKHWVVFWFGSPIHAEFYDSFGRLPQTYSSKFDDFLKNNTTFCLYNNVQVQRKNSDTCGYHVLFYLMLKCEKISMSEIVEELSRLNADNFVVSYVRDNFQ